MKVRLREWNHWIAIFGPPLCGKSTLGVKILLELQKTPAYTIVFDPPCNVPRPPVVQQTHRTVDACREAFRTRPEGLHFVEGGDPSEMITFAEALAQASLKAGGGNAGVPVMLQLDEGLLLRGARAGKPVADQIIQLCALRRPKHVGTIITCQSPLLLHHELYGLATEIVCFRIVDEFALTQLRRVAGAPEKILAELPTLRDHEYRRWRK